MCLARILATNSIGWNVAEFLPQNTCLARMSSVTLGGTARVRRELMARVVPLSSAVICIESITSLCWGGSSRAAIPGVCLALVQGSCSRKLEFLKGGRVWEV